MTLHVVAKTLVPTPPPPHLTAFAWTEERGFLVPAWTELRVHREHQRAGVLVPWDRALELGPFARTRTWWGDDGSFTSQTVDEDGRLIWTCWMAPLASVYLPDDTSFRREHARPRRVEDVAPGSSPVQSCEAVRGR